MSYVGDSENIMQPRNGDTTINLPITFDYSGGRKESNKSRYIAVGVLSVLGLIIGIGTIFSKEGFFLFNLIFGLLIMYGVLLIIRFPLLKEHKIRNDLLKIEESDMETDFHNLWGIFEMDEVYPYYAHLRNGRSALFVMFEKDVIIGKVPDYEFRHYEAIGDAYNLAGSMQVGMCHIDYMDNIGNDERLVECFKDLAEVENPDIKDVLTDIYTNLQYSMEESVSTFDVYAFTFKGNPSTFWFGIQQVFGCLLEANYCSYKILNSSDLRDLSKSLFNIHDFSVVEACSTSFVKKGYYKGIIPIKITKLDGTETILNKTLAEKKEERRVKEKEQMLRKEEDRRRKRNKKKGNIVSNSEEDEIDIF